MEQFLDSLILSLNSIEVKGEDNLNVLLGCIMVAKRMKSELSTRQDDGEEENNGRQNNI